MAELRSPHPRASHLAIRFFAVVAMASIGSEPCFASIPDRALLTHLKADVAARHSGSFEPLLQQWQHQYGARAFDPLLSLAKDRALEDTSRYIALMGAAKLGGKEAAPLLAPMLRDSSWMLRSGALRALRVLRDEKTSKQVLPLLRDKALVVRLEAVEAVKDLNPAGAPDALVSAIYDRTNYHGGKAQWIPQKALAALAAIKAKGTIGRLRPLLDETKDPDLQLQTVSTLESLSGKKLKSGRPLSEKIREWKSELAWVR